MIYLDNAATTKPKDEVVQAIQPYLLDKWYNPSGLYKNARDVRQDIENVRAKIAEFIGAKSHEIYFTSGAAESNNWVIKGFDDLCLYNSAIVISTIEHKSIMDAVSNPALKSNIIFCGVNNDGTLKIDELEAFFQQRYETTKNKVMEKNFAFNSKVLVSVSLANNEIGTIQDIKRISEIVHKYNGILHTDATQAIGNIEINVKSMGIDMLSASAQKIGGLKGSGFLYINKKINIPPLIYGSQENGMRGGTENVIGIIAMGKAVELADVKKASQISDMKRYLLDKMYQSGIRYKRNNPLSSCLPNNINITLDYKITGESLIYILDCSNIIISSGSACNSSSNTPSYVLRAIGLSDDDIARTIRITLSKETTKKDIDEFVVELKKATECLNRLFIGKKG